MSKVAVVTGSAGGLGKGIAERLCKDGYRVVLHDINESMLNKTVSEFKEKNFPVIGVKGMYRNVRINSIWLNAR